MPSIEYSFLQGGGQMGARMRAFDWTSTFLGRPQAWPQSLKTIVRVMLDSRFAMWMLWGQEKMFFCNDAYLPTVGIKRDWVLGAPANKVWAEIWDDIGPRIESVLKTGVATWDYGLQLFLQRNGYTEETFHTFSYSPVYDDFNQINGMLCVVVEETDRIIGERRLHLLSALAALPTSNADSLGTVGERVCGVLALYREDVPFAALYLADANSSIVNRVAHTPTLPSEYAPKTISLDETASTWPVRDVVLENHERSIANVGEEIGHIPSAWEEDVQQVLLLPLATSSQNRSPGVLIAGVSPRRLLDDSYRSFLSLVASQVASRMADAQAYLDERKRSEGLAELDRAKNIFFGNVSHEFRTPLTLMLGPLETLLSHESLPNDVVDLLKLIQRNGIRLRKLVNSLLDFSRIEAGRVEARYEPTDLPALTADIASVFRAAIEAAGLRYDVRCEAFDHSVFVDRDMWEKIVYNLLSNAFKFTFVGTIQVSLERTQASDSALLRVCDTGVGIAADQIPRLFERFHRISGTKSRSHEGTGIGLALVKELVRLHGGSIIVTSELDRGTCFSVSIPLGNAHLPSNHVHLGEPRKTFGPSSLVDDFIIGDRSIPIAGNTNTVTSRNTTQTATSHILVVDDNADMKAYIERLLSPYWRVTTASNGAQALEAILSDVPAVIVTDIMMPLLDGFGLIRRIRETPAIASVPIIVLSARAGEEARVAGLAEGADDYLVKPFSTRELVARVQAQLMRSMMRSVKDSLDQRLAEVFKNAPVGMALLRGPEHTFEFVNAEYKKIVSDRDVVGLPIRRALLELNGQSVTDLLDRVYSTGEPHIGRAFPVMLLDTGKNSLEQHFFDFVYQPLRDREGCPDGIAVVVFEVTELMVARRLAESASRAKDEFIAMLGHELRNPLAPIQTALALMRMQSPSKAIREREIVERQVQHMVRLVDDLLDVSRVTRGSIELKKTIVEFSSIVSRAVEMASPAFEQRRQLLDVKVPSMGLTVSADPVRLSQVIANLLTNASKFSDEASRVSVDARREDDYLSLSVRDYGVGISPDDIESIFDPFVQGSQALNRPQGGLGLGLAIARSLAKLHGGTLSVTSAGIGHGSEFRLRLPIATPDPTSLTSNSKFASSMPIDGTGIRVLIVDDNEDAASTVSMLLSIWGYSVAVAHDGPSAIRQVESNVFDIGLLDIGLPVMDGYELARRLRELVPAKTLYLIALTGYGQDTDKKRSADSGFNAHLVKPIDSATLASALAKPRLRSV